MKKVLGIRHIITDHIKWKYLLFYDLDNPTKDDVLDLERSCNNLPTSHIVYSTKNAVHVIGLTPLDIETHALCFGHLQCNFPSYYNGGTIRMSRRKDENQELIAFNVSKGVTLNLYGIYSQRFGSLPSVFDVPIIGNHNSVFETYWSKKQ